jgi:DinB family protein
VESASRSARAVALSSRLREAAAALIGVIMPVDDVWWGLVPEPGVWSIGKEAEHAAEAVGYHLWIVRLTLGEKVSSRRPALERKQMVSALAPAEVAASIDQRVDDGARLIGALTDEQLALTTRPPRAAVPTLADAIEQILIAHLHSHRETIEAKLSGADVEDAAPAPFPG